MDVQFFVLVTHIFGLILLVGFINGEKPRILNTDKLELITDSNTDISLECHGDEPIKWTYPFDEYTKRYEFSSATTKTFRKYDKYATVLTLTNASYSDTGFYYCQGLDASVNDESRSNQLYLYVVDKHHLSTLDVLSDEYYRLEALLDSKLIIPCRPTSPDVDVKLFYGDVDEGVFTWQYVPPTLDGPRHDEWYYDKLFGYILMRGIQTTDNYFYYCNFTKDTQQELHRFTIRTSIKRDHIPVPYTNDLNKGHTVVGGTLKLQCSTELYITNLTWLGMPREDQQYRQSEGRANSFLTIRNVRKSHEGNYTCRSRYFNVQNEHTIFVKVYEDNEHFIKLNEGAGIYNISVLEGDTAQWRIDIDAHPVPTKIVWLDKDRKQITNVQGSKYEFKNTDTDAFLKIKDIDVNDFGNYTLQVTTDFEEKELELILIVLVQPSVQITSTSSYHMLNTENEIKCSVASYPKSQITWTFKPCLDDATCKTIPLMESRPVKHKGLQSDSYVNMKANECGVLSCFAVNEVGSDENTFNFHVTDVPNGYHVWSDKNTDDVDALSNRTTIAIGESIKIQCAASIYLTSEELNWYKRNDSKILQPNEHIIIERSHTKFSNKILLTIEGGNINDSADYQCRGKNISGEDKPRDSFSLSVVYPEKPTIFDTNMNVTILEKQVPNKLELKCFISGRPKPTIQWFKDDIEIEDLHDGRREFLQNKHILFFNSTTEKDEGKYSCRGTNKEGVISQSVSLKFKNILGYAEKILIYIASGIALVFIMLSIVACCMYRKQKRITREMKSCGLANFEKGDMECINPELGIDDQAELLPYNKNKWEFPRDKLKLGKQLGSGAFGVVMKAQAADIMDDGHTTDVAVKMVRKNTDHSNIKALASELKIMAHLGQNLNVVNLLGACTDNVSKRELLVIVEFCRYGNLHNYLLRHRDNFIDQIDQNTGLIDYNIGQFMDRSYSVSSNRSNGSGGGGGALATSPRTQSFGAGSTNYTGHTMCTDSTTVCMTPNAEDYPTNSNMQPDWRTNYRGDYKGDVQPICTKDLLVWSFQVVRGMEYLASRKVLHGDLAARNILLADNNIVKICDFGLAKSMYKSENYKKTGDGPLPVKWMAVESIRDRIFSTQSDVWSFGIVLWEFFSLAKTPYPGMEADERFYQKLIDGYRMEAPKYATKTIYHIMEECWDANPLNRPSFEKLAELIGAHLDDGIVQHYVDLNDPYLKMNTQRLTAGEESDYLAMFSPPDFINLSSPNQYINSDLSPDGYLVMKQHNVFSPTRHHSTTGGTQNKDIFTFDELSSAAAAASNKTDISGALNKPTPLPRNKRNGDAEATGIELAPILLETSDTESNMNSPRSLTEVDSFSNPSYNIPPVIRKVGEDKLDVLCDNYVKMPQGSGKPEHHYVNQHGGDSVKSEQENHYVNKSSRDWEIV